MLTCHEIFETHRKQQRLVDIDSDCVTVDYNGNALKSNDTYQSLSLRNLGLKKVIIDKYNRIELRFCIESPFIDSDWHSRWHTIQLEPTGN